MRLIHSDSKLRQTARLLHLSALVPLLLTAVSPGAEVGAHEIAHQARRTANATPVSAASPAPQRLSVSGAESLRQGLLGIAADQLAPLGLAIDSSHVWMSVVPPELATGEIDVVPQWTAGAGKPSLPLKFQITSASHRSPSRNRADASISVLLGVALTRDTLRASHPLRPGVTVSCADFEIAAVNVDALPQGALTAPCVQREGIVARRHIAAHAVIRSQDIGNAPQVWAGAPVRISAAAPGVQVSTVGTALGDSWVGDIVSVRLTHPQRVVRARVVDSGAVQLLGDSP